MKSKAISTVTKSLPDFFDNLYKSLVFNRYSFFLKTLKYKYVPYDLGRFSNSMEYSFDDWTVGQFAKSLGKEQEYNYFNDRGKWWRNAIDVSSGYARMKDSKGEWYKDFDPFKSGANHHYVEGNAWQLTFFVPQDCIFRTILHHYSAPKYTSD
ncbi:glycoside hydrolase domain-containing protein, partial [Sphingobacterium multivorum]|uniref:glycoside hydrolase domain-containing protein n=1 Tax=Sphingobacterium multivorum TaxID=28454 RepID=UPI0028B13A8C